jgi:hypothetical protein
MADEPEDLFARLSSEGQELAPVIYRHLHPRSTRATVLRLVESRPYRATGYVCGSFRKPISKCCGPDEPSDEP